MNENQKAAYIQAQAASAMIEALGMQVENTLRATVGDRPAFTKQDFDDLILRYGIHHNAVLEYLRS